MRFEVSSSSYFTGENMLHLISRDCVSSLLITDEEDDDDDEDFALERLKC